LWFVQPKIWESILCCPISCCMSPTTFGCHWVIYFFGTYVTYRQIHTHLCIRYGVQTSIYIYETYFLQNWLPRWNQILTLLRFIHNWVRWGIRWMVNWSVLVHRDSCGYLSKMSLRKKPNFRKFILKSSLNFRKLYFFFWEHATWPCQLAQ
jgi:hypothetical protein